MIVVRNTSPILNLIAIERVDLLAQLYGLILIPAAVATELERVATRKAISFDGDALPWVHVRTCVNQTLVMQLQQQLDPGEAETLVLAMEQNADIVLMDERLGRQQAQQFGISVVGLLGILVLAKERGIIPFVKPLLDDLRMKAGFWISDTLHARALSIVGE